MKTLPVAIVTGAARGIGEAIARDFITNGYAVVLADIDGDAVVATAHELAARGPAIGRSVDVTDAAAIAALVAETTEVYGRIDVLVNNAGRNTYFDAVSMSEDDWDDALRVDLTSAWLMARATLPSLIESRGSIVNITSIHTRLTTPGMFPYAVAKSALEGLTRSLAVDYAAHGVRVNSVAPGWTRTRLVDEWLEKNADPNARAKVLHAHPLRRIAEPEDVAAAVIFLAGTGARAITGAVLPVDAGLSITFRVD